MPCVQWLISPGLPRGGTSYLFSSLADAANRPFIQASREKEVHWLERGSPELLENMYGPHRAGAYYLDFSPGYSRLDGKLKEKAAHLPRDGSVKFIISLRHPVDQAYSHYLHDLKGHVSKGERANFYYPFFGQAAVSTYFVDRTPLFRYLKSDFGTENVLFLNFHTMFDQAAATAARIAAFLSVPQLKMLSDVVNGAGWMPRFVYGGQNGTIIEHGGALLSIKPQSLILLNGPLSEVRRDVPEHVALAALAGAQSWQARLSPKLVRLLETQVFAAAIEGYSALLGEDIAAYAPTRLIAGPAPIPPAIAEALVLDPPIEQRVGMAQKA
ncbi:hypothetical protein SPDO_18550 [Sphingomonas dokdonensis]|uniref:Sulfotransferase domain protein n=2 Tax=Sphingomonas dokdonensis TaxID=344880 RepID=A0A245ZKB3_9SPHN|nr:hypothetical protein SPDO_18550 [Sphingomonas dokdonensis]